VVDFAVLLYGSVSLADEEEFIVKREFVLQNAVVVSDAATVMQAGS
jgi:carbonic anhydrase/acetyltransferase-like protein (isoleucine patch superfamily)